MTAPSGGPTVSEAPARPRMLIVAPSAELYGSDRALLQALPEMVQNFDITLAVPAGGPGLAQFQSIVSPVVQLPDYALRRRHLTATGFLPWLWRCLVALARLHRLHRRTPFDLVYSNTLAACLGPVLKLLWARPHVMHVHERTLTPAWLPKVLLASARASADLVVCNSRFTLTFVVGHQPALAARSVVVHNGVPALAPPPARPPGPSFRITCVGRIHPKKGQGVLLEAVRIAREAGHHWQVHFYGEALPEHRDLESKLRDLVVAYGLEDQVHWHGFQADPYRCYGEADVAVVPSVQPEEFSLVCAEAQVMLLPVVATGPGGPSEILLEGSTGFVVPPNDPGRLFEALRTLQRDPELRLLMGQRGRDHVLAHFSLDVYAQSLTQALLEAVHGAKPREPEGKSAPG